MGIDAICLSSKDNVATALNDLRRTDMALVKLGEKVFELKVSTSVPYGHKIAVCDIKLGGDIIKYGEVIGRATDDIPKGAHVHIHNVESLRGRGDLESGGEA
jgi:altronate dehydratase small subunit